MLKGGIEMLALCMAEVVLVPTLTIFVLALFNR